jgi:transcriptional regulator with XRE-family HTH domain
MVVYPARMKTRILKIKLAESLKKYLDDEPKSSLAEKIGVSPQKLNAMMNDEWEYITRDALERTADFLELDVSEIFELAPVEFWRPIEEAKGCVLLRGSQEVKRAHVRVPRYDDQASQVLKDFMRKFMDDFDEPPFAEHDRNEEPKLLETAQSQNCVVIGSPKTNVATEILLSRFFGAKPFDASVENRRKIPFGFCWPDTSPIVQTSSLTCSELARAEVRNRSGIATMEGVYIPADFKPAEEFREWKTKEGLDCGLVFVANHPFGTRKNVKLIVLAGFGGIGTLAAAKALVQDFRYLEPVGEETCVYGIVEGKYRKGRDTLSRDFRSFRWRHRKGGHAPIL